jgi:predicted  nucleic acid-binding Zn-ribbon protein
VERKAKEAPTLTSLESVRCLDCGAVYSKPSEGGTVRENPGCPECGYVGWIVAGKPLTEEQLRRRSAAGQRPDPAH